MPQLPQLMPNSHATRQPWKPPPGRYSSAPGPASDGSPASAPAYGSAAAPAPAPAQAPENGDNDKGDKGEKGGKKDREGDFDANGSLDIKDHAAAMHGPPAGVIIGAALLALCG
mmetsp:Transcript_100233/g.278949  ORF Transcript_100233/g.278949 Transcript_100233/m.278949 type:complete len:114 (+) Transcript_100233:202-543(+)